MKKINIISMPSAFKRREFMINQFAQLGWDYHIVDATDAEKDDVGFADIDFHHFRSFCKGRDPRPGEIGCYISHLSALEWILSSEKDYGIICEDDVKIYFAPEYAELQLKTMSTDWDMLYLCQHIIPVLTKYSIEQGPNWKGLNLAPVGTQFYAISVKLAEFVLENFSKITMPIDEVYREISRLKKFRFLTLDEQNVFGRHYEKINKSLIHPAAV